MERKSTSTPAPAYDREAAIDRLVEQLRKPRTGASLGDWLVDRVADSSNYTARIGAAAVSAWDNGANAYSIERERQLRRRAAHLHDKAIALALA